MTEYTPTTVTVADVYATANGLPEAPQRREWFYRWFDAEIQAAEQRGAVKGWDEGYAEAKTNARMWGHTDHWEENSLNPYFIDQTEHTND